MHRRSGGYYLALAACSFTLALLPVLRAAPRLHEVSASGLPGWVGVAGFTSLGIAAVAFYARTRATGRQRTDTQSSSTPD